jgi:hypothetical protein
MKDFFRVNADLNAVAVVLAVAFICYLLLFH